MIVSPGPAANGPVTFEWSARDPDDDPVRVSFESRPIGTTEWTLVGVYRPEQDRDESAMAGDERWVWDTSAMPEDRYEVRVSGSDQAANAYGEGRRSVPVPPVEYEKSEVWK